MTQKYGSSKAPTDPQRDHYSRVVFRIQLKDATAPVWSDKSFLDDSFENCLENKQQQRVICLLVNNTVCMYVYMMCSFDQEPIPWCSEERATKVPPVAWSQ